MNGGNTVRACCLATTCQQNSMSVRQTWHSFYTKNDKFVTLLDHIVSTKFFFKRISSCLIIIYCTFCKNTLGVNCLNKHPEMTRCMRNEVNLKSSVYNITGQRYFEQLVAYNSMNQHLRRILLAKSVVDTRNKSYMCRKNKQSKPISDRRVYSLPKMTDDIIDRLAYDTQHHPMDVLKIKPNLECLSCCGRNLEYRQSRDCGRSCCKASSQIGCRQRSMSRSQKSKSPVRASKRKHFVPNTVYTKEFKTVQKSTFVTDSSVGFSRQRNCRYETDPVLVPYTTTTLDTSEFKPTCRSPTQEMNNYRLMSSRTSRSHDDSVQCDKVDRLASQKEDEKKYVNFVYDITKEIMQSGLYTDKELQDVFKKHIDKNRGILNMNRMLYEIYKLKTSFNILDDESDIDDELEDLIHAQKLLHISEIRPPTPPKVLDENKVMEKLRSYQKSIETQRKLSSSPLKKTVVLVDANPDLFVTERDVLISLMEAGVDPKQAQHVCKNLFYRSKDIIDETVPAEANVSFPSASQPSVELITANLELQDGGRRMSLAAVTPESVFVKGNPHIYRIVKQEAKSSSMSDLVATRDETMETEKKADDEAADVHKIELETKPANEVKSEAEASYSYSDSQFEKSEELLDDGRRASVMVETVKNSRSVKDQSTNFSVKQEGNSSNLVSTQDETIETEERTESQTASDNLKIKS